ncbi:hypothetical protein Corgl_0134 [Coriobacterium glomerans PW2]|uniref:Uncharacterized protein n=1 Tax=Coriobacterium glomerans (strain ATCC 49209 / DSM 20642 / JCM 10262 / PW2) TaxID=700015 RepID=F2NA06_CORGP|nr:hypothetical protein [Coriobacterium glomerans]AEB06261.1 hypothetical protein Corgl_0134 [Coriobacterium glomerans PW2]
MIAIDGEEITLGVSENKRRNALVAAAEAEFHDLERRGVQVAGNVFTTILLVKGELNEQERAGSRLLGGPDGTALRSALLRLGYAPENFCALSAVDPAHPSATLDHRLFREAVEAIDPEDIILLDEVAAEAMLEAYPDSLERNNGSRHEGLEPGLVVRVLGRRVIALDGFERALATPRAKQRMWAYLKQLSPLGAPY